MRYYVCKNCGNYRMFIIQQSYNNVYKKTLIHVDCGECGSTDTIETSSLAHYWQKKNEHEINKVT